MNMRADTSATKRNNIDLIVSARPKQKVLSTETEEKVSKTVGRRGKRIDHEVLSIY